jgi:hypothetical protein
MVIFILTGLGGIPSATQASALAALTHKVPSRDNFAYLNIPNSDLEHIVLEFSPPAPEFNPVEIDGQVCTQVEISGLSTTAEAGSPALPVHGALLGIPTQGEPSLRIVSAEPEEYQLAYRLCPNQQIAISSSSDAFEDAKTSYGWGSAYQADAYLPSAQAELVTTGYLRSQRFAQIRLNPLQYNPVSGKLLFYPRMQVEVNLNVPDLQAPTFRGSPTSEGVFENNLRNVLANYDQARSWRRAKTAITPLKTASVLNQPAFKILVDQDGIYQLNYSDLAAAGAPVDSIDPATFQLFNQGAQISIQVHGQADGVFDPGDSILFYGQAVQTKYSKTNVYWLSWGDAPGNRMASLDGNPSGNANIPEYFPTRQHAEKDLLYGSAHYSGMDKDHWYWDRVYATSAPTYIDFNTQIKPLSPENQMVTVRGLLKGYFANPNHHTRIYLNGNLIHDASFPTGAEFAFEVEALASYLHEGVNTLRLECPRDGAITLDGVYFNWFEIDYLAAFMAENDQIVFNFSEVGEQEFRVDGFSSTDLQVYDLTDPQNPLIIQGSVIQPSANGQQLSFETTINAERSFLVQSASQRLSPLEIVQDLPSAWKSPEQSADYILITHADFYTQALQLANFHISRGLRVKIVDVQDIYDEFNYGIFSPEAIHSFLKYAYANWTPPSPSYVLLMGDGHYDYRRNLASSGPNFIPPYLDEIDYTVGETATDNRYASVSGDDILPDLYIGRFPVSTPAEAAVMVEKTINYSQQETLETWNTNLLFVADDPDSAGNFPGLSDEIIDAYIPESFSVEKIYYSFSPYTTATSVRTGIKNAINAGQVIVHYGGHGATPFWAAPALFRVEEVAQLTNQERLPFMLPMTCAEGYFIRPDTISSLGESIVRKSGGGAIASWSPTGFGTTVGHQMLDESVFSEIFENNQRMLGYLTTQAKYDIYARTSSFSDLIETYTLFGDPALQLQIPKQEISINYYFPAILTQEN